MVLLLGVDSGPLRWQNINLSFARPEKSAARFFVANPMHLAAQTMAGLCVIIGLFIVLDILDS